MPASALTPPGEPSRAADSGQTPFRVRALKFAAVAGVYAACAMLSRELTENPALEASFWLPSGLMLGLLLTEARRDWALLVAAMFAGDCFYNATGATWPWADWFFVTVGNAASAVAGAWLVQRWVARKTALESVRELIGLMIAAALSLVITSTIGARTIYQLEGAGSLVAIWTSWFFSDLLGVVLVTPLILVWRGARAEPRAPLSSVRRFEAIALVSGVCVCCALAISLDWLQNPASRYVVVPFVVWAAIRFGPRGVTVVSLVLALLAGWFALHGHGLDHSNSATAHERNVELQLGLSLVAFFGLIPAITIAALRRQERELLAQRNFHRAIFDHGPEGMLVLGPAGELLQINRAALAFLEAETLAEAGAAGWRDAVLPEARAGFAALLQQVLAGGRDSALLSVRGRRGGLRWLDLHATPLRDAAGGVTGLLGVIRDVTARRQADEALAIARFSVDRAHLAIVWVDRDANAAACVQLGYTREEMLRLRVEDIDVEFSAERWPRHWEELRGRESVTFQSRQRRKDGVVLDVVIGTYLLRVGETELACAFVQDITEQLAAEQRILGLNRRLELAVGGAGYGVWEYDLQSGVVSWDERMHEIHGVGRGQFDGTPAGWPRLIPPEARTELDRRFAELVAGRPVEPFELAVVRAADGARREIEANGFLQRDGTGRPQRLVGMNRDITDQRQAERALRRSEAQLKLIFSAVADGVVVQDRALRIVQCNTTAERILGLTADQMAGRTSLDPRWRAVHEDGRPFAGEVHPAAVALRTGLPVRDVVMGVHKPDGALTWISVNAEPLRDPRDGVQLVVSSFADITASRALQQQVRQAQKMEVVGQLAGGVAHDFNNILTAIMLNLQLIAEEQQFPEGLRPPLAELQVMTRRAAKLTEQLLLFARRRMMRTERLELNAGISQVLALIRRVIGEHVNVTLQLAAEPLWVDADAGMIDQVVMNLCVNARDAMPAGGTLKLETSRVDLGPELPLSAAPGARPGRFACLRVSDTGCGMPPDVLRHLFEPFFTTKEVGKGTGLGLATVHGIVHQHQGWIEVDSEVGRGTSFRVLLPLAADVAAGRPANPVPAIPGGHETVLLVEDEPAVRLATSTMLRRLGYLVVEAGSGPEALGVWHGLAASPDILVTDMVMPGGVTGLELGETLRRLRPELAIVVTSGYTEEILKTDELRRSGIRLMAKPYEFAELAVVIRQALAGG